MSVNVSRGLSPLCLNLSLLFQILSIGLGKQASLSMPDYTIGAILTNGWYLASMLCLVCQAVVWPIALRFYSLSFAYFYMSLVYVAILLQSWAFFHEEIGGWNIAGALLILGGVNLMTEKVRREKHD